MTTEHQDTLAASYAGWVESLHVPTVARLLTITEQDPDGKNLHEAGAKADAGKNEYDYVLGYFSNALGAVNEVAAYGAKKYTPGGWVTVPDGIKRYGNAAIRHHNARLAGQPTDNDTKLLHAAHEAWNALAVLELLLKEQSNAKS
jgi:predicted metal-dependent phosphoesterase TrpH